MAQHDITLISFGYFDKGLLEEIAGAVMSEFRYQVKIREGHVDLSDYFDASRRQYNGNKLLLLVESMALPESDKTLGLFSVDLFIPILTYIFGQAALNGMAGIASLHRLNNEYYGIKADKAQLADRFKKEVIHELGHTFGLIHCKNPSCVMRSSTYVEDIDMKEAHLCHSCRDMFLLNSKEI
jgi:archaemetzincin